MMKICRDCAFGKVGDQYGFGGYCYRSAKDWQNPVTGSIRENGVVFALAERNSKSSKDCGPEGRHFKPKPTLWSRAIALWHRLKPESQTQKTARLMRLWGKDWHKHMDDDYGQGARP